VIRGLRVFGVDHGTYDRRERGVVVKWCTWFRGKSTSGFNVAVEIPLHRSLELVLLAQG